MAIGAGRLPARCADNPGLFRAAHGGTVFLDEIGDMPLAMQAKLLRVLEEEEVVPIGESFPVKVDVRVLSATNRDLRAEIKRGTFREDLYYRLAVFPIRVPPLRERLEDVPVLAERFLKAAAERHHKRIAGFDDAAMQVLTAFDWPGNVRELQNEIERAVALTREGETISAEPPVVDRQGGPDGDEVAQPAPAADSNPQIAPVGTRAISAEPVSDDGSLREAGPPSRPAISRTSCGDATAMSHARPK